MKNSRMPTKNHLNKWIYFSQAGLQMAITIAVCSFFGVWLDTKLVGVIGAMYSIIRKAQQMTDES